MGQLGVSVSEATRRAWTNEHESIYGSLLRLGKLAERADTLHSRWKRRRLITEIDTLLAQLERHFERETQPDGIFDTISDLLPDSAGTLERLCIEHDEISEGLYGVKQTLVEPTYDDQARLPRELTRIADLLYRHEAVEESLTKRVLNWPGRPRRHD